MDSLIYNSKIEVKKSPIHGYGVFAKENIKKGEILEECHFMSLPLPEKLSGLMDVSFYQSTNIGRYYFLFPRLDRYNLLEEKIEKAEYILPFGTGCIYNSSPNANADWDTDIKKRLLIFKAIKDIEKGKEIFTNYELHLAWCKKINLI
tara:strand:+ start:46 stop:489 length:444 start_codon:yes stop_codon:yes gene_type:complete